ncbi:tRNA epoxyqueuosine(34) reductase QueG [Fodinicurvata sp. EGI_FJ10296]|uniref:tRNA epoxyqueuosine(34) reductase QueG n=1 Tax=Fodinicurvata sp. EGI_FJ10296 TaxID=3231908 RepID=UPI003456A742
MTVADPTTDDTGSPAGLRSWLRSQALEIGFDAVGFAPADAFEGLRERLDGFLAAGYHGDMGWLAETADRRAEPRTLWGDARTVMSVAINYGPADDPMTLLEQKSRGAVSVYARNRDYHDTMKKRLKALARAYAARTGRPLKVFVDTAPVMEKPIAERAGLGWTGKHTNLVSRRLGSWFFLGEMFLDIDLPPDEQEPDHCGSCNRCLSVCPTDAFPAPYRLDATRCISYLTIEHKGHIPEALRAPMGNRIYGCDDCLAVCPWNKFASRTNENDFLPRVELSAPRLADLADLDDAGFRDVFRNSPVKRIGRDRFVRNVMIAIGNSAMPALLPTVRERLSDSSTLVRAMAVWAFSQLADSAEIAAEAGRRRDAEPNAEIRQEWDRALKTG